MTGGMGTTGRRHAPRIVGRPAELARLRDAVGATSRAQPVVLFVTGEAGIGKTSLVRAALDESPVEVVWVTADATETSFDLGVADRLVRRLSPTVERQRQATTTRDSLDAGMWLLRALDDHTASGPTVLVVDDAHLADVRSLEALAFVARRLDADDVAVVLVARDDALSRLPAGLVRLADGLDGRIALRGLDVAGVGDLVREVHGASTSVAAAARLHRHTQGNPLHTVTLLEELDEVALAAPADLPTPRSFRSLVLAKLAACSPEARRFAAALAVLDGPVRAVDVARVAGLDDPVAPAEELHLRELLTVVDDATGLTVEPAHALIRATVLDDLPAGHRAALHRAAALVTAPEQALFHRLAAADGDDADLAAEGEAAAAQAVAEGMRAKAAELFLAAARAAPRRADHERLVLMAGEQLFMAGLAFGPWARAIDTFADSPRKRMITGLQTMGTGRFDRAGPLLVAAYTSAASAGETQLAGLCAEQLALGGDAASARLAMAAVAGAAGDVDRVIDARLGLGVVALWSNHLDEAVACFELVIGHRQDRGALRAMNALAYLAETRLRQGRILESIDLAERCVTLVDDLAMEWLSVLPRSIAAFGLAVIGELGRAGAHAAVAASMAEAIGQVPARIWSTHAALRVAAAADDHHAVAELGDAMTAAGWSHLPEGVNPWRATYAETLAALGRCADAATVVAQLEANAVLNDDIAALTEAARARAAVAVTTGDGAAAAAAFAAGLALDPVAARPLPRARLELAAGAHLRRAGQRSDAAGLLTAASRRFATMGATNWLERCERELVACGLRPRRRADPPPAATLTAQEREVARAVMAGQTNREIAGQLAISAKTVEHHLSRIYAKLGVRGRTQVAGALGDVPL